MTSFPSTTLDPIVVRPTSAVHVNDVFVGKENPFGSSYGEKSQQLSV